MLVVWSSSDAGSAVRVLEDMGARPRTGLGAGSDAGAPHDFRAKNGGFVAVRAAERTGVELAFEFDGDVRDLAGALTAAGCEPVVIGDGPGRSLRVRAPWGTEVRILEPRGGRSGGTVH